MYSIDGPVVFDAFEAYAKHEQRLLEEQEYREYLSGLITQGKDTGLVTDLENLLPEHFKRWGEAGAVVVDIALREVPPVELSLWRRIRTLGRAVNNFTWPEDMFAMSVSSSEEPVEAEGEETPAEFDAETKDLEAAIAELDGRQRTDIAAKMFADARHTGVRPTLLSRPIKFDRIEKVRTDYRELLHYAQPFNYRLPELRQAYEEGFAEKAEDLGFPQLTASQGFEVLNRAPGKLRFIKVGQNADGTKARVFTEHGALLTLHQDKEKKWVLPTTMQSIWERTRAQSPASPDALALFALRATVIQRVHERLTAGTPIVAARPSS